MEIVLYHQKIFIWPDICIYPVLHQGGYNSEIVHPACHKRKLLGTSLMLLTKVEDPSYLKTEVGNKQKTCFL